MPKPRVLFLCTGNSCRSQMAEGWAKELRGADFQALSAGIESHGLNPLAVQVMAEAGVDISTQTSNLLSEITLPLDLIITVCSHAAKQCPWPPGHSRVVHHAFDDPPKLATTATSQEEALGHYRRVRDEIRLFITTLVVIP